MERKTIKLQEPIQHGAETIHELHVRKPKAKDMRGLPIQMTKTDDMLTLLGRVSGRPPSVIDELSLPDMAACMEALTDFLPDSPATGSTASA